MPISTNLYLQNVVSGCLKNANIINNTNLDFNELNPDNPIFYYRPVISAYEQISSAYDYDKLKVNSIITNQPVFLRPTITNRHNIKFRCQITLIKQNQKLLIFDLNNFYLRYSFENKCYLGVATRFNRNVFDGVAIPLPQLNSKYTIEINERWCITNNLLNPSDNMFKRQITIPINTTNTHKININSHFYKFNKYNDLFDYYNNLDHDKQLLFAISHNHKQLYSDIADSKQTIALSWYFTPIYYNCDENYIYHFIYNDAKNSNLKLNQITKSDNTLKYNFSELTIPKNIN